MVFTVSAVHSFQSSRCKVRITMMITKPYSNWKDAKSDVKAHSVLEYHRNAMALMTSFKWTMVNPATRISQTLSENTKQQVQRNRTLLKSIIKVVEICGRQEWALRGYRDDATSGAERKGMGIERTS